MSKGLRALVARMRHDVVSARHRRAFAEAQRQSEYLARYSSAVDVLEAFADRQKDRIDELDRLTRALIVEHRKRSSALWAMLLVVGYHPMLACLRCRVHDTSVGSTEIDQRLLYAFLETIEDVPVECDSVPVVLYLHRRTARALFVTFQRDARAERSLTQLEYAAPELLRPASLDREQHSQSFFDDLCRRVDGDLDEVDLQLIAMSVLDGDERELVVQGMDDPEPTHLAPKSARLRRKRTRAIEVLRQVVSPKDCLFERSA